MLSKVPFDREKVLKNITYKDFDAPFDEVTNLYKPIAEDYPERKTVGIFESYDEIYTEGAFKLGAVVSDESEVKEGYTLGTLPASSAAIWQGNVPDLSLHKF